jgi:hypothetical protein
LKSPDLNAAFDLFGTLFTCIERWANDLPGSCSGSTRVDELLVKDSLFTFQDTEDFQRPLFRFLLWGRIHAGFNTRTLGGLALQTRKADVETGRENCPKRLASDSAHSR